MDIVRKKRFIEWIKTAAIVLLALSALFLGRQTGVFSDVLDAVPLFGGVADLVRGASGTGTSGDGGGNIKEAARPTSIVITNSSGGRYGVKYDTGVRNSVYERTSSILGEAIGSASATLEISAAQWRAALSGAGLFFEYVTPVKLSVLCRWLGSDLPDAVADAALRYIFIAFGTDRSSLYYQNVESGACYMAETASSSRKAQDLDMYSPNGAVFAFETGIAAARAAPFMLILPGRERSDVRAAPAGNADELLDIVLYAMGHQNEIFTPYYDSSGVLIRVGAQFNIRADAFGRVLYLRTDALSQDSEGYIPDESETIEKARVIAADTIGGAAGGAEVFFESIEYGEGSSRTVYFGYYIAGGHIDLNEYSNAARISFTAGTLVEMELIFRNYTLIDEYTRLLPERQALAAAGGEFILCYSDSGAERLDPTWVKFRGGDAS